MNETNNAFAHMEKAHLVFLKVENGIDVYQVLKNTGYNDTNIPEGVQFVTKDLVESSLSSSYINVCVLQDQLKLEESNLKECLHCHRILPRTLTHDSSFCNDSCLKAYY